MSVYLRPILAALLLITCSEVCTAGGGGPLPSVDRISIDTPATPETLAAGTPFGVGGYYTTETGDNILVELFEVIGPDPDDISVISASSANPTVSNPAVDRRWSCQLAAPAWTGAPVSKAFVIKAKLRRGTTVLATAEHRVTIFRDGRARTSTSRVLVLAPQ